MMICKQCRNPVKYTQLGNRKCDFCNRFLKDDEIILLIEGEKEMKQCEKCIDENKIYCSKMNIHIDFANNKDITVRMCPKCLRTLEKDEICDCKPFEKLMEAIAEAVSEQNELLNAHGKYVLKFAENHGISIQEAHNHPTVKAHLAFLTGMATLEQEQKSFLRPLT